MTALLLLHAYPCKSSSNIRANNLLNSSAHLLCYLPQLSSCAGWWCSRSQHYYICRRHWLELYAALLACKLVIRL
jgi:hypothetical protein